MKKSDHFGKMYGAGKKMGFAQGGQVKDTGLVPARRGTSQQEIEAGGTPRLKPGFKHGGYNKGGYKTGGSVKAKASDLGTGMARKAADASTKRNTANRSALDEAMHAAGITPSKSKKMPKGVK